MEVNARLVYRDGHPVGIQGIARDISERKRLEQGLRQAQKMEAIGRLAGGVAHDFNNLLTVIIGHSEAMIERLTADDPERAEAVQIFNAGECAADLTRQLLAFSRQQILAPKVLDVNAVVGRLAPMFRRLIGEDIEFAIRTGAEPSSVKADPGQLEQVILNLVVNARDAMPEGGTISVQTANAQFNARDVIDRVTPQAGQYVVLVVGDTGQGMTSHAKAQRNRIGSLDRVRNCEAERRLRLR
jgi:signal transduction histidine kinase